MACFLQRAQEPARGAASDGAHRRADSGRSEPAGGDYGAKARNGQHAQTGEEARAAADQAARRRALARAFGHVVLTVAIGVAERAVRTEATAGPPVAGMPVVGIVGDQADAVAVHAGALKILHGVEGLGMSVEKSGDGFGHGDLPVDGD